MVCNFGFIPNLSSQLLLHIISYLHLLLLHGLDGHLLAKQISLYCHRISQYCFTWLVSCTRSVNYSINKQIAQLSTMNTQLAEPVLSFSLKSYDLHGSSCYFSVLDDTIAACILIHVVIFTRTEVVNVPLFSCSQAFDLYWNISVFYGRNITIVVHFPAVLWEASSHYHNITILQPLKLVHPEILHYIHCAIHSGRSNLLNNLLLLFL